MIESMPGILYFYDQQGRFLRWNRNFEIVTGYSGEEIMKMHPLDFFRDGEKQFVAQRIEEVLEKGVSSVEPASLQKTAQSRPFFFTGRLVVYAGTPCLVGMGIDISERKWAEKALIESEQKLQALFDQAPLGIALIDSTNGKFLKINPRFCKIAGYPVEEILGATYQGHHSPRRFAGHFRAHAAAPAGGTPGVPNPETLHPQGWLPSYGCA